MFNLLVIAVFIGRLEVQQLRLSSVTHHKQPSRKPPGAPRRRRMNGTLPGGNGERDIASVDPAWKSEDIIMYIPHVKVKFVLLQGSVALASARDINEKQAINLCNTHSTRKFVRSVGPNDGVI